MAEKRQTESNGRQSAKRNGEGLENKLEDAGRRVGRFFASAAARAREEAEDIWAEAQSVRRGERH
jgi:hypothetical protein